MDNTRSDSRADFGWQARRQGNWASQLVDRIFPSPTSRGDVSSDGARNYATNRGVRMPTPNQTHMALTWLRSRDSIGFTSAVVEPGAAYSWMAGWTDRSSPRPMAGITSGNQTIDSQLTQLSS